MLGRTLTRKASSRVWVCGSYCRPHWSGRLASTSTSLQKASLDSNYDAVIIGGGHNGLTAAAYLARAKKRVLVLERRHVIGGAAITEELYPGFHFTRASYCLSLLRPTVMSELDLKRHGLKIMPRGTTSSFTPLLDGRYLMLGPDDSYNSTQVSKFSTRDAEQLPLYESMLENLFSKIDPLIDVPPYDPLSKESVWSQRDSFSVGMKSAVGVGKDWPHFFEILTAPATKIINRWFESEPLRCKLLTDAITGAFLAPSSPGSGYVLFHHCMGDLGLGRGIWANVQGGMGQVSQSIAKAACEAGAQIVTDAEVTSLVTRKSAKGPQRASGVVVKHPESGKVIEIQSKIVLSNADPSRTMKLAMDHIAASEREKVSKYLKSYDFSSATFKINLALDKLPQFKCLPSSNPDVPGPQHFGTIHFVENSQQIEDAYNEAKMLGVPSSRPFIEMTLPSALDSTIAPPGKHVATLFVQYAPYHLDTKKYGGDWTDPEIKQKFANSCYRVIEDYCPGFTQSILYQDLLSPKDLEQIFGLTGGNIFHGAMGLDQLYWTRPFPGYARHETPLEGFFLCGSGAHPGGGVMGAAGRNTALLVLSKI